MDKKNDNDKITNIEAFFSSWKSSVGVGVYSMPYAFYQGSPIFGFLIFLITVLISTFTTSIMAQLRDYLIILIENIKNNSQNNESESPTSLTSNNASQSLILHNGNEISSSSIKTNISDETTQNASNGMSRVSCFFFFF